MFKLKLIYHYRAGNMPNCVKEGVVRERLASKLSEGQLDIMLSKKPRKRSKKWTNQDYARSQQLSLLCNRRAYDFVKDEIAPLPGFQTARKKILTCASFTQSDHTTHTTTFETSKIII